jgi:hypothetical protein
MCNNIHYEEALEAIIDAIRAATAASERVLNPESLKPFYQNYNQSS